MEIAQILIKKADGKQKQEEARIDFKDFGYDDVKC